jgi:hypothetical protein
MFVQMVDIMKEANTKANTEHKEFEMQLKKRRKVCTPSVNHLHSLSATSHGWDTCGVVAARHPGCVNIVQ